MSKLESNKFESLFQEAKMGNEYAKEELMEYHRYLIEKNSTEEECAAQEEDLKDQIDYCLKLKKYLIKTF